ncbi:hypothetical protein RN001_003206 [Aquatica leii]|uniref:Uncharacterized protein n=1 Tax=Aquatica leii TaxID=1421715 RepID=A0AAN7SSZ5_9COLE|nr:hypothetical protein RN001_003206 [Aquatica leii]
MSCETSVCLGLRTTIQQRPSSTSCFGSQGETRTKPKSECLATTRSKPKPPLVDSQPALLETIINIAIHGSAADERRRTEMIRSCFTLNDLHERLLLMGFQISRNSTYLHLLPRVSNTQEGRRHVRIVPVKLARPQTQMHKKHENGEFCAATIRYLESLASLLGPQQVFILSQDDKARVPIGLPAVKSKSLLQAFWSGKHASSTANTRAYKFRITCMYACKPLMMTESNTVKPVIIIFVDGGPDENPRYRKVNNFAIQHFKKYNLDALFIATNAPGRNAFNRVERCMAPLSKRLSGVIQPHEHFGSHLDEKGMTVDGNLEKRNFQHALSDDADWLDEVDASGLTTPEPSSSALRIPVMKEFEWLANPWTMEQ